MTSFDHARSYFPENSHGAEEDLWKEQFKNSFRTFEDLQKFLGPSFASASSFQESHYPLLIPLPLAELIKLKGPQSALAKQFLPHILEGDYQSAAFPFLSSGLYDPIGDKRFAKKGQLIHRYHKRVLFTPTTICPVACRYCFRKNELTFRDEIFSPDFSSTMEYLTNHPEINEIIFSGGDPLILSNERLQFFLEAFRKIPHIHYIRFHTRTPVILPDRITSGLISLLQFFQKHFKRINFVIHVNHTEELSEDVLLKLKLLNQGQITLLSQTVLLKGVNDSSQSLKDLFEKLIEQNIRPYYLHHPDQVQGGMHFYLPLEEGRKIYSQLRKDLPGWGLPQYVIDIPGGEGKVNAFNPESFSYSGQLINKDGQVISVALPEK